MKKIIPAAVAAALTLAVLTGCTSDADKASENLSTAAEQFEVQRQITGINGISDKPVFFVEGRCSIEDEGHRLVVTCKHGPDDYRKHFVGLSDNTFYLAEQMEGIDVDEYHTRIIVKPEELIPYFDLQTGAADSED